MSARKDHFFYFSAAQIAEAAEARATELQAELAPLHDDAVHRRNELEVAISLSIDSVLAGNTMAQMGADRSGDGYPMMAEQRGPAWIEPRGPSNDTIGLFVDVAHWTRFSAADSAYRRKRATINAFLADAARYKSQVTEERAQAFALDEEDVRHFGLDR